MYLHPVIILSVILIDKISYGEKKLLRFRVQGTPRSRHEKDYMFRKQFVRVRLSVHTANLT